MRIPILALTALGLSGCFSLQKPEPAPAPTATGQLTACRFDFSSGSGATALCMSGDAALQMSFPACAAGKPEGPGVQPADELAVFSAKACISDFGGQKWVVDS